MKMINTFEEFKLWLLFEILAVLSTIGTSMIFLFQRAIVRESTLLVLDNEDYPDENADYLDGLMIQITLQYMTQTFIPPISHALMKYFFEPEI